MENLENLISEETEEIILEKIHDIHKRKARAIQEIEFGEGFDNLPDDECQDKFYINKNK